MTNRYVIALNRLVLAHEQLRKRQNKRIYKNITNEEVDEVMNFVRKYPQVKIDKGILFTCGFSKN